MQSICAVLSNSAPAILLSFGIASVVIWRRQVCMEKAKLPNFERKAISSSVLGAPRAVLPQGVVLLDPWKLETSETNIARIEHEQELKMLNPEDERRLAMAQHWGTT